MIDDFISAVEGIPGTRAFLYADDLVVWATSSNIPALEAHMNCVLGVLGDWAGTNEIIIKADKTDFQLFSLSTKQQHVTLRFEGVELKQLWVSLVTQG